MRIYSLMLSAQAKVTKILKKGMFSDEAIEKAVDVVKDYSEKIDKLVGKIKDSWTRQWVKEDHQDTKVYVEASATAKGDATLADSTVKLAMIDTGSCTLTVGTATSLAVADGGEEYVQATVFSKATGVDTGTIMSFESKGPNYEKATECIVLLDWKEIYDKNWVWERHHKVWSKAKKEIPDANIAVAKADVDVQADTAVAITDVSALAIGETVSQTYAAGYGEV